MFSHSVIMKIICNLQRCPKNNGVNELLLLVRMQDDGSMVIHQESAEHGRCKEVMQGVESRAPAEKHDAKNCDHPINLADAFVDHKRPEGYLTRCMKAVRIKGTFRSHDATRFSSSQMKHSRNTS